MMLSVKIVAATLLVIFIGGMLAPSVMAFDTYDYKEVMIPVNLEPGHRDTTTQVANLTTESVPLEKDFIQTALPQGTEGKYWGPYLKSSLFQFDHIGGKFQIVCNFTVTSGIIMNGVSEFWARIPIVPSQYSWWHVYISWNAQNKYAEVGTGVTIPLNFHDKFKLVTPWDLTGSDVITAYDYSLTPGWRFGNVWSISNNTNHRILYTDAGLFIRFQGVYPAGEKFIISFTGQLKDGESPQVFLTQELLTANTSYPYHFFDYFTLGNQMAGWQYDYILQLPIMPAWAFIFTSGIGKENMMSYVLDFTNSTSHKDYLEIYSVDFPYYNLVGTHERTYADYYRTMWGYTNTTNCFSFYMPFETVKNKQTLDSAIINWWVKITLLDRANDTWHRPYWFGAGVGSSDEHYKNQTIQFPIIGTSDYLLFTCPEEVSYNSSYALSINEVFGNPRNWNNGRIFLRVELYPITNCTLKFLAYTAQVTNTLGDFWFDEWRWTDYRHTDCYSSWSLGLNGNINEYLPIMSTYAWTPGIWAQVTETAYYWIYDFGWGHGYWFPGVTNIYIFLDDGGKYMYSGSYPGFIVKDKPDIGGMTLAQLIQEAFKALTGFIYDGLTWIWNQLVSIGKFIWNIVSGVIGWIVSIVKDIAGKVTNIIEGLLYGFPIIATLFIVNYVGGYLQSGHFGKLPKATKERRLIKKVYRKTIRQPSMYVSKRYGRWSKGQQKEREQVLREKMKAQNDYDTFLRNERQRLISEEARENERRAREAREHRKKRYEGNT